MSDLIDLRKVREIVNERIRLLVGEIEEKEPKITFAIREKWLLSPALGRVVWRVNAEYTPKPKETGKTAWSKTATFMIDAETEEVLEFDQGRYWRF